MKENFNPEIKPLPKGCSFSNEIEVRNCKKSFANKFHKQHHSYLDRERHNSIVNHVAIWRNEAVASISYAYPLMNKFRGYCASQIIEVARVSVALDMDNLASCIMSHSQDKFKEEYAKDHGIHILHTLVADEKPGTMFKALKGKGWIEDGDAEGHQAGNRNERSIRDEDKNRYYCELDVESDYKQIKLPIKF